MDEHKEIVVTVSMRFPVLDSVALAGHIGPVIAKAIEAGGIFTTVNVMPYDPEEEAE